MTKSFTWSQPRRVFFLVTDEKDKGGKAHRREATESGWSPGKANSAFDDRGPQNSDFTVIDCKVFSSKYKRLLSCLSSWHFV